MSIFGRSCRVAVLPALLALLVPAHAAADSYEPNESAQQARGPLTGGAPYPGQIGTSNDVDWFYVYVGGQREIDLSLTVLEEHCSRGAYAQLYDTDGWVLGDTDNSCYNSTGHFRYTTPGPGRYFIRVSGREGASYELRIDPADALTMTPPPPVQEGDQPADTETSDDIARDRAARCARHRDGVTDARERIRYSKARLRRTDSYRARQRIRRRIARLRQTLAHHREGVWANC